MACRKIKAAPVNPFNYDANINTTLSKEMPGPTLLGPHLSVKFKNYNCKFYSSPQMPLLFSYRGGDMQFDQYPTTGSRTGH